MELRDKIRIKIQISLRHHAQKCRTERVKWIDPRWTLLILWLML